MEAGYGGRISGETTSPSQSIRGCRRGFIWGEIIVYAMPNQRAMRIAAIMGLLAVALGAMGAHALEKTLAHIPNGTGIWEKAVFYHFIHAVMLFILAARKPLKRVSWFAFLIGILLFSGSLYIYAVSGPH